MDEMTQVAAASPWLEAKPAQRAEAAMTCMAKPAALDVADAEAQLAKWGLAGRSV
jgi:hypothetical protein